MKWCGYKQIPFKSIRMDVSEIRQRSKAAHVAELADDIRKRGGDPIHAPTIRDSDKRLLCGRDRMAALITLKAKKIWVHVVDCDDGEAKELELAENIYRRAENRAALIAEMVGLKEQQLRANTELTRADSGDGVPSVRGGNDPIKTRARREVARAAGISPASVKKAEQRARASAPDGAGAPDAPVAEDPVTLELFVDDVSTRAVCKFALPYQLAIDAADKHLQLALGALKPIENSALGQELRAQVQNVGGRVRSERPGAICPWCKGLPKATFGLCGGCKGQQWVTAEKAARAPAECREASPPIVMWNGKPVPYADALAGKFQTNGAPAKKSSRRIKVEDEAGNEIPLDSDEAY